jgi:hypothetical protein
VCQPAAPPRGARGGGDQWVTRGEFHRRLVLRRGGGPVPAMGGKSRRAAAREGGFPPRTCSRSASRVGKQWSPRGLPAARMPKLQEAVCLLEIRWRSRPELDRRVGLRPPGVECVPRAVRHRDVNQKNHPPIEPGAVKSMVQTEARGVPRLVRRRQREHEPTCPCRFVPLTTEKSRSGGVSLRVESPAQEFQPSVQ